MKGIWAGGLPADIYKILNYSLAETCHQQIYNQHPAWLMKIHQNEFKRVHKAPTMKQISEVRELSKSSELWRSYSSEGDSFQISRDVMLTRKKATQTERKREGTVADLWHDCKELRLITKQRYTDSGQQPERRAATLNKDRWQPLLLWTSDTCFLFQHNLLASQHLCRKCPSKSFPSSGQSLSYLLNLQKNQPCSRWESHSNNSIWSPQKFGNLSKKK